MTTSLVSAFERVDADLATTPLSGQYAVFSLRSHSWVHGESGGLQAPQDFGDHGYVLVAFGSQLLLDEEEDVETMAVELASALQDLVVDQLGAGWPELSAPAGGTTILTPALIDRRAAWTGRGRSVVAIGDLQSAIPSTA